MYIFQEKILELMRGKGISQKEISKITGIDYVNVNRYFRGIVKPSIENLVKLAKLFSVSTDYLLGLEKIPFSSPEKAEIRQDIKKLENKLDRLGASDAVPVPLLEDKIAAGAPFPISGISSEFRYFVSAFLKRYFDPLLVQVGEKQESMFPTIHPGDLLLLDRNMENIPDGSIYALNFREGGTIKRVWFKENYIIVKADNPSYRKMIINIQDKSVNDIVVGRVVWIGREL